MFTQSLLKYKSETPINMLPPKAPVKTCLINLLDELIDHDGFGSLKVDIRLLRRGQKEIIIDCGKQYRFVVDFQPAVLENKNSPVTVD